MTDKTPENLSKREYFAGLAMHAMIATKFESPRGFVNEVPPLLVLQAVKIADALIEELNKEPKKPKT